MKEIVDPFDEMIHELSNPTSKMTFKLDSEENEKDFFDDIQKDDEKEEDTEEKEEEEEIEDEVEEVEEEESKKILPPKKPTEEEKVDNDLGEYESDIAKFVSSKLSEKLGEELGEFDNVGSIIDKLAEIVEENSTPEFANDEVAKIDKFVRDGGDLRKFYADVYEGKLNLEELDIDEISDQKRIIKESLKNSGYSDPQIKRKLERYEESGVLQEEAEEALDLVKEFNSKNEKKLLKEQENLKVQNQNRQQNFISDVQSTIKDIKEIAGIPLSDKEKKEILSYALVVGRDGKTAYQRDYDSDLAKNFFISAFLQKNKTTLLGKAEKLGASKLAKELQQKMASKGKRIKKSIDQNSLGEADALDMFSKQLRRF